jgi:hypothetical protein
MDYRSVQHPPAEGGGGPVFYGNPTKQNFDCTISNCRQDLWNIDINLR